MDKKIIYILTILVIACLAYLIYYFNSTNIEECISDNIPVCGVDNITYQDFCSIEKAGIEIDHSGACQLKIANPASEYCVNAGGNWEEILKENGNYGLCLFEDNRQCEEWALFRGECPMGGVKITGYDNREQVYCAITGGEVSMAESSCSFGETVCDLNDYYNGDCLR